MSPADNKPINVVVPAREAEPANGNAAELVHVSSGARHVVWARLLWERRRFIRRSTIAGFLLFIVISLLITPTFESKARLMPVDQQMGSGLAAMAALVGRSGPGGGLGSALGGGLGGMASELLGIKNSGALLVDMLGGPTVQDEVIKKLDLMKVYHSRYWQDARRRLGGQTELNDDRKSGVITITVTDRDRVRAQQIAQAYVEALNAALAKVFTSSARRERQFLEQRVKTVKENLDAAAQQFSQFQSKNVTLDLPSQSRAMLESEASLEGQLIAAQSELEGLEQIYTDNNLRVRTLRGKIGSLRHQIETMSGREGVDGGAGETAIPGDLPSIRKLPLVGVQWASLYRESKIQETVYELLTEEYEFAKVQEAKEIPTVNVLDAPLVPEKKSSPKRTLIVIFGTFLAFSLACAFIIGSDVWRQNQSAEKEFVSEVWSQIAPQNSRTRFVAYHVWRKLSGPNGSSGNGTA